jgi:hypothetical protein
MGEPSGTLLEHQGTLRQPNVVGTIPFVILPQFAPVLIGNDHHWCNIGGICVDYPGVEGDGMLFRGFEADDMGIPLEYGFPAESVLEQRIFWTGLDGGDCLPSAPVSHGHPIPDFGRQWTQGAK